MFRSVPSPKFAVSKLSWTIPALAMVVSLALFVVCPRASDAQEQEKRKGIVAACVILQDETIVPDMVKEVELTKILLSTQTTDQSVASVDECAGHTAKKMLILNELISPDKLGPAHMESDNKPDLVYLRLSMSERALVGKAAKGNGVAVSDFVQRCVNEHLHEHKENRKSGK